jgi:hypothetical protein
LLTAPGFVVVGCIRDEERFSPRFAGIPGDPAFPRPPRRDNDPPAPPSPCGGELTEPAGRIALYNYNELDQCDWVIRPADLQPNEYLSLTIEELNVYPDYDTLTIRIPGDASPDLQFSGFLGRLGKTINAAGEISVSLPSSSQITGTGFYLSYTVLPFPSVSPSPGPFLPDTSSGNPGGTDCGLVLVERAGRIFIRNYANNVSCGWVIRPAEISPYELISVIIQEFDTEEGYDKLLVRIPGVAPDIELSGSLDLSPGKMPTIQSPS